MNENEKSEIQKQQHILGLIKSSGLPQTPRTTHRLENFLVMPGNKDAFHAATSYIAKNTDLSEFTEEQYESWNTHHFLTFYGPPGTGKTHLALSLAWHYIEEYCEKVVYFQVENLLDELRASYSDDNPQAFSKLMEKCKNCELLVLDDLGAEQSTAWSRAKLDLIIDCRYIEGMHTVFTTNYKPSQLSERIASRLSEGIIATLDSKDFRKIKAQQRQYKVKAMDEQ